MITFFIYMDGRVENDDDDDAVWQAMENFENQMLCNNKSSWNCSRCTFLNEPDSTQCTVCSFSKTSIASQSKSLSSNTGGPTWKCTSCGARHPMGVSSCNDCSKVVVNPPSPIHNTNSNTSPSIVPDNAPPMDPETAKEWIYPTNYPVRDYQLSIVEKALFQNTLVSLPTGLGKTLIAAVVMYNFYRWYPTGKVVFMAPTKPLVTQQIKACHDIVAIPQSDTAEMQGSVLPDKREALWKSKRVFYCTPQSLQNDLASGRCFPSDFVCLVFDEAHRATKNYAYCVILRQMMLETSFFRVLALSATPGANTEVIQDVITSLNISHIECRTGNDPDVRKYTHARQEEVIKCTLNVNVNTFVELFKTLLELPGHRLHRIGLVHDKDVCKMTKYGIILSRDRYRDRQANFPQGMRGVIEGDFALLITMLHGYGLLTQHGVGSFASWLQALEDSVLLPAAKRPSRAKQSLVKHDAFRKLMMRLKEQQCTNTVSTNHPKMAKLREILIEHFERHGAANSSTRAIVFTQYRGSVEEIVEMLTPLAPLLKAKAFVGQGAGTKGTKGLTQKMQQEIVRLFREGEFNVLIATCIAEEGLDIGEVDLIVSFDALASPTRMIQRMGRTGRKRVGKVMILVTEGSEERKLQASVQAANRITRALTENLGKFVFYKNSSMIPNDFPQPVLVKKNILIKEWRYSQVGGRTPKGPSKKDSSSSSSSNALRRRANLSDSELAYLNAHYFPDMERPKIYGGINSRRQQSLTKTWNVPHSLRSKGLVKVMQFIKHKRWQAGVNYSSEIEEETKEDETVEEEKVAVDTTYFSEDENYSFHYSPPAIEQQHQQQPEVITIISDSEDDEHHMDIEVTEPVSDTKSHQESVDFSRTNRDSLQIPDVVSKKTILQVPLEGSKAPTGSVKPKENIVPNPSENIKPASRSVKSLASKEKAVKPIKNKEECSSKREELLLRSNRILQRLEELENASNTVLEEVRKEPENLQMENSDLTVEEENVPNTIRNLSKMLSNANLQRRKAFLATTADDLGSSSPGIDVQDPPASQSTCNNNSPSEDRAIVMDDSACYICGSEVSYEHDPIVYCDKCDVAVHQHCYGIPVIPGEEWLCEPCSTNNIITKTVTKELPCALCPVRGGALKRTNCNQWVHIQCFAWTPELSFCSTGVLRPGSLSSLDKDRKSLTCQFCCSNVGAVLQCVKPNCLQAFHVTCAKNANGCLLIEREDTDGVIHFDIYCVLHQQEEKKVTKSCKTPRTMKSIASPGDLLKTPGTADSSKQQRRRRRLRRRESRTPVAASKVMTPEQQQLQASMKKRYKLSREERQKYRSMFIESEVDVDGASQVSGDENADDFDRDLSGFIDYSSEVSYDSECGTQELKSDRPSMEAIYAQSLMESQPTGILRNKRWEESIRSVAESSSTEESPFKSSTTAQYTCNGCADSNNTIFSQSIQGTRYACRICPDYNLCMFCYSNRYEVHDPKHTFLPIDDDNAFDAGALDDSFDFEEPIIERKSISTRVESTTITSSLTQEQKRRMEENRRLAEERRKKKKGIAEPPRDKRVVTEPEKLMVVMDSGLENTVMHHELSAKCIIEFRQDLVADVMPSVKVGIIKRIATDIQTCCQQDTLKFLAGYLTEYFTDVIVIVENDESTSGRSYVETLAIATVMSKVRFLYSTDAAMSADIIHHIATVESQCKELDFRSFEASLFNDTRVSYLSSRAIPGISFGTALALVNQGKNQSLAELLTFKSPKELNSKLPWLGMPICRRLFAFFMRKYIS